MAENLNVNRVLISISDSASQAIAEVQIARIKGDDSVEILRRYHENLSKLLNDARIVIATADIKKRAEELGFSPSDRDIEMIKLDSAPGLDLWQAGQSEYLDSAIRKYFD